MKFLENLIGICLFSAVVDIALPDRRVCWDEREFDNVEFTGYFKEIPENNLDKCKEICDNTSGCHVVKLYKNPNRCFINDGLVDYWSTEKKFGYLSYFTYSCEYHDRMRGTTAKTTTATTTATTATAIANATTQPARSESKQTNLHESLETDDGGLGNLSNDSRPKETGATAIASNAQEESTASLNSITSTGSQSVPLESVKKSAEASNPIVVDANLKSDEKNPGEDNRIAINANSKNLNDELNTEDRMSSSELQSDQESIRVGGKVLPSAELPWLSLALEINLKKFGLKNSGKYLSGSSEDESESGTDSEPNLNSHRRGGT